MNRRLLVVWLMAATPALLCAQEAKLVNCRTLEAAGNFVGPDEVIDGNMVCQRLKPGVSAPAKPQPEPVITPEQPMSVAEAARANKQRLAAKQNGASAPAAAAVTAVPTRAPAAEPAVVVSKPVTPEIREPAPAAAPAPVLSVSAPESAAIAAPLPSQPAPVQPVAAASAGPAAPAMRVKRDAPVAAGTPSEPPEKDYGFSDANAVEAPTVKGAPAAASSAASLASRTQVQVGAFGAPKESPAADASQSQRPECAKNITLGSLQSEKLALGAPAWAQAWIARNQKAVPSVCFSAGSVRGAKNYLIVFYFVPAGGNSNATAMPDSTSAGAFTAKDGSMWSYTGGVTQEAGQGQVWYVTAYAENGAAVAEEWPEQAKRGDHERVAEELLSGIVEDLRKL
jgi:hypothetical protein